MKMEIPAGRRKWDQLVAEADACIAEAERTEPSGPLCLPANAPLDHPDDIRLRGWRKAIQRSQQNNDLLN
jgi:hypothetical protein